MRVVAYYSDASLSACFHDDISAADPSFRGDADFYAKAAGPEPIELLDLGCGTGRLSVLLAERGHKVSGVDLSPEMLRAAHSRMSGLEAGLAARLRFVQGDMSRLSLGAKYDLVIAPSFGFAHVLSRRKRAKAISCIARHLNHGGQAILHVPSRATLYDYGRARALEPGIVLPLPSGDRLRVRAVYRALDEQAQVFRQTVEYTLYDGSGAIQRQSCEEMSYGVIDDQEMGETADAAGLTLDVKDGGLSGPVDPKSRLYYLRIKS